MPSGESVGDGEWRQVTWAQHCAWGWRQSRHSGLLPGCLPSAVEVRGREGRPVSSAGMKLPMQIVGGWLCCSSISVIIHHDQGNLEFGWLGLRVSES